MDHLTYTTVDGRAQAEIIEKKSRFIAQIAHVATEDEALAFLEGVRAAHRTARHHVYAYMMREGSRMRYSDDGEPQKTAGLPTLTVIQHAGLTDVIIVTTRYFGGVLLGTGGLVRAYSAAAQDAIAAAQLMTVTSCVNVNVVMSYSMYEQSRRIADAHGAKIQSTDFSDAVTLVFVVPDGQQTSLIEAIDELSRGQARISESAPFDAAF